MQPPTPRRPFLALLLLLWSASSTFAQQQPKAADTGLLTLDTVFTYRAKSLGPIQWQQDGKGYLKLEPSASKKDALDFVRYEAVSGAKSVLVPAEKLIPRDASQALAIDQFDFSDDEQKLLIF